MKYYNRLIEAKKNNSKILIIGNGIENKQFITWLVHVIEYPKSNIEIADQKEITNSEFKTYTGNNYLTALDNNYALVIKAPGIWSNKLEFEAYRQKNGKDSILSSLTFFVEQFRNRIVMITGTKGKTTTSSWIAHILKSTLKENQIEYCGNTTNISPYQFWNSIDAVLEKYFFVLEVSSFQLQDLGHTELSPKYAAITNLYIDHLDQHVDKEEYWQAKDNIFLYQQPTDYLIITSQVNENINSRSLVINSKLEVIDETKIQNFKSVYTFNLIGEHNISNLLLANSIASLINQNSYELQPIIESFQPPKGRLELIKTVEFNGHNLSFYNDNTATEPDAVVAALDGICAIENSKTILILSGKWKKGNHQHLADTIKKYITKGLLSKVFYLGQTGAIVYEMVNNQKQEFLSFKEFMKDYLQLSQVLESIETTNVNILFSPSGSSWDEFQGYVERGDYYIQWVQNIGI
jgi:UDP-N-acetylmuramoylalanine--D-glutamate ligase